MKEEKRKGRKAEATYVDALGREVPAGYVPKFAKTKDAAARKVLARWRKAEKYLAGVYRDTVRDVERIREAARKEEGLADVEMGAGYFSFRSFDGKIVVRLDRAKEVQYNEKIDLAKEELDAALEEIAGETVGDLREIVGKAFAPRGRNRSLDRQRLNDIVRMNVRNAHWRKAAELIKAAEEEAGRKDYLRVTVEKVGIVLDLHSAARNAEEKTRQDAASPEGGAE